MIHVCVNFDGAGSMSQTIKRTATPKPEVPAKITHRRRAGRPSRADAEKLDQRILETAHRSFIERGFSLTTIEKIAADCGTTRRSVTHRFADKDVILIAVAESWAKKTLENIMAWDGDSAEPLDVFRKVCRKLLSMATDPADAALYGIFLGEVGRIPELTQVLISNNDKLAVEIERIVLGAQEAGLFKQYSAATIAASAIGIMVSNPLNRAMVGDLQFRNDHQIDLYFSNMWSIFQTMA